MVPPNDGNSQNMLLLPDGILGGFTKPRESRISETTARSEGLVDEPIRVELMAMLGLGLLPALATRGRKL